MFLFNRNNMEAIYPIPRHERISSFLQSLLGACFIAICAQIKIPLYFTPVPLTVQTVGVLLAGAFLGSKKGMGAALLYLAQGALGWPVWAGGASGFHHLFGPTGGYLLGYPLEAFLMGWFLEKCARSGNAIWTAAAILIPCTLQMGIGTLWLAPFIGLENVLAMGFAPFIFWEMGKSAFTIFLLNNYKKEPNDGISS